jgi:hypothetical protein
MGKENALRQADKQPVTPARARCNGGRLQNLAFELGTSEQLHSFGSEECERKSTRASTSDSAGTKVAVKPASKGMDVKKAARRAESPSKASTSPQQENDLLTISSDAANNPAVVGFRNCIVSYFARGMQRGIDGTWAELVTRATEGECRMQFDGMAQTLSKRFGNQRAGQVMQQLIETTLLPAAKAAARGKSDTGVSAIPPQ